MSLEKIREFHFTVKDLQLIRKLIFQDAGISLNDSKRELVYGCLARCFCAIGIKSFTEYLDYLQQGDEVEWEAFTNSLTANLTAFFREAHYFPILVEHPRKAGAVQN
jgi:chemotaxis protein methyltransferase CheR